MKKHLFIASLLAAMALSACTQADDDSVGSAASDMSAASASVAASDISAATSGLRSEANDPASAVDAVAAAPSSGASQ
jgi:outer membrane lipoprotein-sorting protein